MTSAISDPITNCYLVPRLFRDCSEGNYESVKEHIKSCCDVNEIGLDGETPLTCAINASKYKIVELLLKSGADPNLRPDKVESTPLMDASNIGHKDIVHLLLEYGANPDIKSATNNTALHYAACGGHSECCRLLLDYSTDRQELLEVQNENGHTGLMEAATSGFLETTKFFVNNGAQINIPSAEFKETALTLASYKGYSDIVQFLLEAGADHEHRTDEMHTALMEASMEGHIEAARVLLDYGAQVNMRVDSFESPLTLAACSGHTDLAGYLISYGADIEEVNDESYTPLMEAAREGHLETVVMLLALGAQINRVTEETQETAMTLAACGGFYDIVILLHRCGGDIEKGGSTPLMESAQEGHLDIVKALVCMGANIEAKNASDETSLHFAAENGHVEVCLYLLECNANIHHTSEGGRTALMKASRAGNLSVVILLVERGACIDQLTIQEDHNALSLACANGHCKVVEYLLKAGADPTIKLKDNCTVLIEASRAGHSDVIETLLKENRRNKKFGTINNTQPGQHLCSNNSTLANIEMDINDVQHFTSQYPPMDDLDNFIMQQAANQQQQQQSSSNIASSNIRSSENCTLTSNSLSSHAQSPANVLQFQPCHITSCTTTNGTELQSKSGFNLQIMNNVLPNEIINDDHMKYIRPLFLTNEIPDPPSNSPPMPTFSNCSSNQVFIESNNTLLSLNDSNLSMSLMGIENQKLLRNILDPNSPNIEEWVQYICPNFNNNLYTPSDQNYDSLSKLNLLQTESINSELPHLLQQTSINSGNSSSTNTQFHRKIKKAKHSDNYSSVHSDICRNCPYSYHQRLTAPVSPEKSISIETNCGVYRYPGEGVDCDSEGAPKAKNYQKEMVFRDPFNNNDSNKDCAIFTSLNAFKNNSKLLFSQSPSQNIFLTNNNNNNNNKQFTGAPLSSNSTSTGGMFSIDKVIDDMIYSPKTDSSALNNIQTFINTSSLPSYSQDNGETDVKRMFNSVTPTSVSPIKVKYRNLGLSAPFQKQVLQPKRRLQQNQRSPQSNLSQISTTSSGCSEHKLSPLTKPIFQSDQFLISSTPVSQNIFDSISFIPQESNCNFNTNFTFPDKNFSNDERVEIYQQTMLSDLQSSNNMLSSHVCQLPQECNTKHGLMSPSYHLDFMPKIIMDNCDIPKCKPGATVISSSNSIENLEVVEEMDNEDNDEEDDFESEIEIDHCNASPFNNSSISHSSCMKHNCKKKLNVNVCTESLQESPLSLACSGGHLEVVKLLINSGAKLEHRDKKSQTALHVAVLNGHVEVVKFLLDSEADIESMVERTKDTALSIACANGKYDIVEVLVNRGAVIEHRNISDYTPLSLAASGGYVDIIKFLLKNNAEINSRTNSKLGISPLMLAAMNGHVNALNVLLENGSDINAQIETNRNTALTLACFQGRSEVVSLLVEKKAYVEHRAKSGLTPLMEAASQGHVEVGRILISAGAEINAAPVPSSRETVLIIAADKGHTEFVKLLLLHGALVEARNKKGDTPLWLACSGGYIDVVKLLIDYKADVNSADNRRITCLMIAFKKGHIKVVKELVKFVTQFPSEHDCNKHLKSIKDAEKDLINKCETCKEIILKAKERQEYEAAKNAKDLLKQVEEEKKAKEQKEVKQAKKREKKKAKKKAKQDKEDSPKNDIKDACDDVILSKNQNDYLGNYYFEETDIKLTINNNNENINPEIRTNNNSNTIGNKPSNKSSVKVKAAEMDNKAKSNGLLVTETKSKKLINGIVSLKKEEHVSEVKESFSSNISNTIEIFPSKPANVKGNTWIQISSNKGVQSNKIDENMSSHWQKIGGNKKKLDIQVNKKDIGKVIGQGGSVVNAIRYITGAHIDIDSIANELDERTVHLKGSSEAVHKAKEFICDLVKGKITGNHIIQESETYLAKPISGQRLTSSEYGIVNPGSNDTEYSKNNVHTKLTRNNGKAGKLGYNSKFNLTTVTSNNNNNNLQYGFSKSVKGSDFATVAAAGIIPTVNSTSVTSSQSQRVKYSEKITYNGNYHNAHFPSLSEANADSFSVNQSSSESGNKMSCVPSSSAENEMIGVFSQGQTNEKESSMVNEPLEINTNMQIMNAGSVGGGINCSGSNIALSLVQVQPSNNNVSKSFPLAPGSERSLYQRTYNSTPEHSPQIENSTKTAQSKSIVTMSSFVDTNSSESTIASNNSDKDDNIVDFSNSNANNSCINSSSGHMNSMNSLHSWTPMHNDSHQYNEFTKSYPSDSLTMNPLNNDNSLSIIDYEVLSHYPKLQSLNPKAEAFSPAINNLANSNCYGVKPEDLYYNVNGTMTLNPSANIFKPRNVIPVHGIGGNIGSTIQPPMSISNSTSVGGGGAGSSGGGGAGGGGFNNPTNINIGPKSQSKYDHNIVSNNNSTMNKNIKNSPAYSVHQTSSNVSNTQLPSSTVQNYCTNSHTSFVVPQEERVIRLQDHINKAINILISTTNYNRNMAEAAFSSFMRSANLDLNSHLTSSEFTALINNIMNQSPNPPPSAPLINPPNNISQQISFLPTNNGINCTLPPTNHLTDLNSGENFNRVFPTQNPLTLRQPIILNPIPPAPQTALATQSAQTPWPLLNNVSLSNFNSIWAAPGSNNALGSLNSPYFSTLGHCVSAQTAFNSALSFNIHQSSLSTSNSNEMSVSFGGACDNSITNSSNNSKNAALSSQKLANSNNVKLISASNSNGNANNSISLHDNGFDKNEL